MEFLNLKIIGDPMYTEVAGEDSIIIDVEYPTTSYFQKEAEIATVIFNGDLPKVTLERGLIVVKAGITNTTGKKDIIQLESLYETIEEAEKQPHYIYQICKGIKGLDLEEFLENIDNSKIKQQNISRLYVEKMTEFLTEIEELEFELQSDYSEEKNRLQKLLKDFKSNKIKLEDMYSNLEDIMFEPGYKEGNLKYDIDNFTNSNEFDVVGYLYIISGHMITVEDNIQKQQPNIKKI